VTRAADHPAALHAPLRALLAAVTAAKTSTAAPVARGAGLDHHDDKTQQFVPPRRQKED